LQRPVLAAALAEAVGKVIEHLFIDRAQKHLYRPLDYLVLKGRDSPRQMHFVTARLRNML
jgi:hypothetical protein